MSTWTNRATREAFQVALHGAGDELAAIVREWEEALPGRDFLPAYAARLREDFTSSYGFDPDDPDGRLLAVAALLLLRRVDWRQVAERLVARARENPADAALIVQRERGGP